MSIPIKGKFLTSHILVFCYETNWFSRSLTLPNVSQGHTEVLDIYIYTVYIYIYIHFLFFDQQTCLSTRPHVSVSSEHRSAVTVCDVPQRAEKNSLHSRSFTALLRNPSRGCSVHAGRACMWVSIVWKELRAVVCTTMRIMRGSRCVFITRATGTRCESLRGGRGHAGHLFAYRTLLGTANNSQGVLAGTRIE